jgi:hypothetical protein
VKGVKLVSRALLRTALLVAAVGVSLAIPSLASASSATLTSPQDGATYYTGDSFPWVAQVPTSASFNRDSSCAATKVGGIQRSTDQPPSGNFASEGGTSGGTFTKTVALGAGDYQFRAWLDCGEGSSYTYSGVRTIHVKSGNPPSGGGPDELVAICTRWHSAIAKLSAINNRVRNELIPPTELATNGASYVSKATSLGSKVILANEEIPGAPILAKVYDWESKALKVEAAYGKVLGQQMKAQVKHWDAEIVKLVKQYESDCNGITVGARSASAAWAPPPLAAWAATRLASLPPAAVSAKAAGPAALLSAVKRNTSSLQAEATRFGTALSQLTAHLGSSGAPAANVRAAKVEVSKAVRLLSKNLSLTKALARNRALSHLRLGKRYVPRSARRDRNIRKLIGKPLTAIIVSKDLVDAQNSLIAVLRAQPVLP